MDNSVLLYLVHPKAPAPIDPESGKPVEHCIERIEGLLDDLEKEGVEIVVPTPVLSELLIKAPGREPEILSALTNRRAVRIVPFDSMAAIENAILRRPKSARHGATKKEVSFDLQILAITRTVDATMILTDDATLRRRAIAAGIKVKGIGELGIPETKRQHGLPFDRQADEHANDANLTYQIEHEVNQTQSTDQQVP
ncbi:hypothetical protein [Xanthomonas sacchari]|uniref:hypothetical protein n=1 Tax=Xanthomonas sacchari TaxID=56458 RepID=UPI003529B301